MFKRYWREYPWFLQLLLFVLMIFTLGYFALYLGNVVINKAYGVSITGLAGINATTPRRVVAAATAFQAITHLFTFTVPCLLFAYLTHPRPTQYLGLRKPGRTIQPLLVILIILGALPFLTGLDGLLRHFDFGQWAKQTQNENDAAINAFLKQKTAGDFLISLFVFAALPALGEELLFRGLIMRYVAKRSRNMLFPILISGIMFAVFHSNPYGLFSIFIAGLTMGVIYWLTGSLWMSMLGHLLFNGTQVALFYAANNSPALSSALESNVLPLYIPVAGGLVMVAGLYLLWKARTPLAADWSQDFTPEERSNRNDQSPFSFL